MLRPKFCLASADGKKPAPLPFAHSLNEFRTKERDSMTRNDRLTTKHGSALLRRNRFSILAGTAALMALAMTGCSRRPEAKGLAFAGSLNKA